MSFLTTTAYLHFHSPLPTSTTLPTALSILQNHETIILFDPEYASHTSHPPPPVSSASKTPPNPNTKYYTITDHMEALPKGLWDTKVSFQSEITDVERGVEWVIRAPLGLVQRSWWTVEDMDGLEEAVRERIEGKAGADVVEGGRKQAGQKEKGKRYVLSERLEITCSRFLVGYVKGKVEANWKGIHEKYIRYVEEANKNVREKEKDAKGKGEIEGELKAELEV
jgi:hypothetical protein